MSVLLLQFCEVSVLWFVWLRCAPGHRHPVRAAREVGSSNVRDHGAVRYFRQKHQICLIYRTFTLLCLLISASTDTKFGNMNEVP
ncbi:hypothetical protein [Roseateles depolymerans]|uniref:hypothetical protein n=1 Tax=Roseateles depolymerans TaxID=76731 RepID=UPI001E5B4B48|nr:hypothetical protein [Roseateles depolymerans]